jgi:hypothetical protein
MGMPLSAAEKLQALGGHWSTWITQLEKKYIIAQGGLKDTLPKFDVGRGRPFQVLASLVYMVHDPESRAVPSNVMMGRFLERGDRPERPFQLKVEMTMAIFVALATDYYDLAFGTVEQRVAPVGEFPRSQRVKLTDRVHGHRPAHLQAHEHIRHGTPG